MFLLYQERKQIPKKPVRKKQIPTVCFPSALIISIATVQGRGIMSENIKYVLQNK